MIKHRRKQELRVREKATGRFSEKKLLLKKRFLVYQIYLGKEEEQKPRVQKNEVEMIFLAEQEACSLRHFTFIFHNNLQKSACHILHKLPILQSYGDQ